MVSDEEPVLLGRKSAAMGARAQRRCRLPPQRPHVCGWEIFKRLGAPPSLLR